MVTLHYKRAIGRFWILFILAMISPVAVATKIASVNMEKVLAQSVPGIKANKKLKAEFSASNQALEKEGKQLYSMQRNLKDKSGSKGDRANQDQNVKKLATEFVEKKLAFEQKLNQRKREELMSVQKHIYQVIGRIAAAQNLDAVVEHTVYSASALDITQEVIKELNKEKF